MPTSSKQLDQVRDWIKTGKKKQAVTELVRLIEKDHDNPELWWLLANATDDFHQARRALEEMQVIAPQDTRAEKMLKRLDTRIKLDQMGLQSGKSPETGSRSWLYAGAVLIVILIAAAAFIASGGLNRGNDSENILPTSVVIETTVTETVPTETETEEQPTGTATTASTATPQPATNTQQPPPTSTTQGLPPAEVTVDVQPPTSTNTPPQIDMTLPAGQFATLPASQPSSTFTAVATTVVPNEPIQGTQNAGLATRAISNSESTAEVGPSIVTESVTPLASTPVGAVATATTSSAPLTGPGTPTLAPTTGATSVPTTAPLDRGQVVENIPRRDLIEPYGVHAFTFSGYRDEKIALELRNLSGDGNPSLELRDANGEIVASDIDVRSAKNLDAQIEMQLPADGIYTVIVRMASVDQQLYILTLKRG